MAEVSLKIDLQLALDRVGSTRKGGSTEDDDAADDLAICFDDSYGLLNFEIPLSKLAARFLVEAQELPKAEELREDIRRLRAVEALFGGAGDQLEEALTALEKEP